MIKNICFENIVKNRKKFVRRNGGFKKGQKHVQQPSDTHICILYKECHSDQKNVLRNSKIKMWNFFTPPTIFVWYWQFGRLCCNIMNLIIILSVVKFVLFKCVCVCFAIQKRTFVHVMISDNGRKREVSRWNKQSKQFVSALFHWYFMSYFEKYVKFFCFKFDYIGV